MIELGFDRGRARGNVSHHDTPMAKAMMVRCFLDSVECKAITTPPQLSPHKYEPVMACANGQLAQFPSERLLIDFHARQTDTWKDAAVDDNRQAAGSQ